MTTESYEGEVLPRENELVRLLRAFGRVLAGTFDVGFMVAGSGLIGLALATLLDGFDIVQLGLSDSTGEMLGSALVVAVLGAFGLGVAVEGPVRRGLGDLRANPVEKAIIRGATFLLIGTGFLFLGQYIDRFFVDLPEPFGIVSRFIASVGLAGMTICLVVVPIAMWALHRYVPRFRVVVESELPLMYAVWAVGTTIMFGSS